MLKIPRSIHSSEIGRKLENKMVSAGEAMKESKGLKEAQVSTYNIFLC